MKWVCQVCGYVHEGDQPPEACPVCKAPAEKFTKQEGEKVWACEHVVGVASTAPEEIKNGLREMFNGECSMSLIPSGSTFVENVCTSPKKVSFSYVFTKAT